MMLALKLAMHPEEWEIVGLPTKTPHYGQFAAQHLGMFSKKGPVEEGNYI